MRQVVDTLLAALQILALPHAVVGEAADDEPVQQVVLGKTFVFMSVIPDEPAYPVAVVSGKRATLGAGWAAVRGAMPKISPLRP